VSVVDENDHDPEFNATVTALHVAEGNRVATRVGRVTARDRDDGANARLTYSLRPLGGTPDDAIDVVPNSGDVVATVRLDYETRREYRSHPATHFILYLFFYSLFTNRFIRI